MNRRHVPDVDLDAAYLQIMTDEAKRRRQEASARRQQRVLAVLSENPPSGVHRLILCGRYTTKQVRDAFDLEPDEVQDFVNWIVTENPAEARFLGDGIYEFVNLELEIRDRP